MTANEALRAFWRITGDEPEVYRTATDAVREIEQRYRVTLPADFRSYVTLAAPQEEFFDGGGAAWWSPSQMENVPDGYEHQVNDPVIEREAGACILFADYLIWCWAWAICCGEGKNYGKVALIGGAPDHWAAESFTEFVVAYLRDPKLVS